MRKLLSPGTIHVRANALQSRNLGRMKCIANVNPRAKSNCPRKQWWRSRSMQGHFISIKTYCSDEPLWKKHWIAVDNSRGRMQYQYPSYYPGALFDPICRNTCTWLVSKVPLYHKDFFVSGILPMWKDVSLLSAGMKGFRLLIIMLLHHIMQWLNLLESLVICYVNLMKLRMNVIFFFNVVFMMN